MDVTIKDVPSGISEADVVEWVSILVERKKSAELKPQMDAVLKPAQDEVDAYRVANKLTPKFTAVEAEPVAVEK